MRLIIVNRINRVPKTEANVAINVDDGAVTRTVWIKDTGTHEIELDISESKVKTAELRLNGSEAKILVNLLTEAIENIEDEEE